MARHTEWLQELHRQTSSPGGLLLFIAALAAGMLVVGGYVLAAAYRDVVDQTRRVATNLTLTVERDIGRDLRLIDRSVKGVIDALALPGIDSLAPTLRRAALFDQAMNQEEFGAFIVIDAQGQARDVSGTHALPTASFSDRLYFIHHRDDPSPDVFVGPVVALRIDGQSAVTVSHRMPAADGSFRGVVVGAIHLPYFRHAFERLDLGSHGSITLIQQDGTILLRDPDLPDTLEPGDAARLVHDSGALRQSGFGVAAGPDGVPRFYAFRQVLDLPLFVVVGFSVREVMAPWLHKLAVVGPLTLLLCVASILLARALGRELVRRQQAERDLLAFNQELEARVAHEVAAREEAQDRLVASQRMEALGQLAGGVAHDLNNVLQAVSSANQLLSRQTGAGGSRERLTGMIAEAAERGAAVTRRLLVFARQSDLKAEVVDAAALVRGLRELLVHTLGSDVEIEVQSGPHPAPVVVDRVQLETVLINLATNARDAMAGHGGVLTLRVERRLDRAPAADARTPLPAEHVCIIVRDTGCGMSPEVQARAREPFYTTKPVGKGTGLGLAMASGFAEQSGGRMTIDSRPGAGTTVTLWLPPGPDALPEPRIAPPHAAGETAGAPRVLLVDDDPVVRELLAEELSALGYAVAQAGHAATALGMLDPAPDVLVTDFSMPGMDGLELIGEAHRRAPGLPAILVTGYAGDEMSPVRLGASQGEYVLLHKPLDVARMASHLAILLRTARPPGSQGAPPACPAQPACALPQAGSATDAVDALAG